MGVVSFPVVGRHVNFQICGAFDHVLIGYDITRRINDETGPEALQGLADFARPDPIIPEELRVKILKRIAHCPSDHALRVDIHHGW